MSKLTSIVTISILAAAAAAYGQGAPAAKPAADKPPAAAKPEAPKPAPELKKEYDGMIGTWKCEGKGTMMGKEIKGTGTYKAAWDLDGYWVNASYEGRAAGMPGVHKAKDVYGYDSAKKQFINMSVDNMGGWSMSTSSGWQGDKEDWSGKSNMMGQEHDVKFTITKKGDKEITISGSEGADSFEDHCKK